MKVFNTKKSICANIYAHRRQRVQALSRFAERCLYRLIKKYITEKFGIQFPVRRHNPNSRGLETLHIFTELHLFQLLPPPFSLYPTLCFFLLFSIPSFPHTATIQLYSEQKCHISFMFCKFHLASWQTWTNWVLQIFNSHKMLLQLLPRGFMSQQITSTRVSLYLLSWE